MWGWDIFHFWVFILSSDCWKEKYIKYYIFDYALSCEKNKTSDSFCYNGRIFIHSRFISTTFHFTNLPPWFKLKRSPDLIMLGKKILNSSLNVWFLAKWFCILILDINIIVYFMVTVEVVKNLELYFHLPPFFLNL